MSNGLNGILMAIDFNKEGRTIMTRGVVLCEEQMEQLGILKVFNTRGLMSGGGFDYFFNVGIRNEQRALVERKIEARAKGEPYVTVSLIIFRDLTSMNLFVIGNKPVYEGTEEYLALSN